MIKHLLYPRQKDHNITRVPAGVVFDELVGAGQEAELRRATIRIRMNSSYIIDTTKYKSKYVTI